MKVQITVALFVLAITYGCTAKKTIVTLPEVNKNNGPTEVSPSLAIAEPLSGKVDLTTEALVEGKSLYGMHCAKCHDLFEPKSFTAEEWKPIVLRMQKEASISDTEREKIYAYLTTPQM